MSTIVVHAGDYKGNGTYMFSVMTMPWMPGDGFGFGKKYMPNDIESVETASEEAVKRLGGTVGWGIAGAALLGPLGLLAGLLVGGRGKDVTFVVKFKDGKKIMATTDSQTYTKIAASNFA